MCQTTLLRRHVLFLIAATCLAGSTLCDDALAQAQVDQAQFGPQLNFKIDQSTERLEMIVNTSRHITLDKKIPRIQVNNPDIVKATPLSPYKIQLAAAKPGVTQVNLWDEDNKVYTIDLLVFNDARELQMILESEFPNATLKVRPLASSVILSGYVDKPEDVSRAVKMAEDFYPKIINNIRVGGVQQVLLHVKVVEVSRTKLRQMGFDWAVVNANDVVVNRAAGILSPPELEIGTGVTGSLEAAADTLRVGVIDGATAFFGFLEALRQYNMAKLLAEPTLVTVSGRPASFNVGGEFPILVPGGLGTVSIEYKQFGTRVDFVPIVLGNGNIRLEVRPSITERDDASGVNGVPAIRTRWVDTAAELKAGQTLALAGLVQNRIEAENRGVPVLADMPWAGALFRRVEHNINEVELLVLITPELVGGLDPHEVPQCLPGSFTTTPSDKELYGRGYIEVPKCCDGYTLHGGQVYQDGPVVSHGTLSAPPQQPIGQPVGRQFQPANGGQQPTRQINNNTEVRRMPAINQATQAGPVYRQERSPAASQQAVTSTALPGLIGPSGYDELD